MFYRLLTISLIFYPELNNRAYQLLFSAQTHVCFSLMTLPVFNILVHVGVVLTYPILISIGTLLSVPGNAGRIYLYDFKYYPQFSEYYRFIISVEIEVFVKLRINGHTYCGFIMRGQHLRPLCQTDYTASLPL